MQVHGTTGKTLIQGGGLDEENVLASNGLGERRLLVPLQNAGRYGDGGDGHCRKEKDNDLSVQSLDVVRRLTRVPARPWMDVSSTFG